MFLYGWLHLAGFDLPMEEIKNFRQLHSKTPGHPEYMETPGVECTTGPLGQGVANAVGMAVAGKMAAAHFNTAEHEIFNHQVIALAGDGCLQEGVAAEAASLAGHLALDNLTLIYDSNDVTLDAMADASQSESVIDRFAAYGFNCILIEDGHNMQAIADALAQARSQTENPPSSKLRQLSPRESLKLPEPPVVMGEGGAKFAESARQGLGLPEETFYVSDDVRSFFESRKAQQVESRQQWDATFSAWQAANPDKAALLASGLNREVPADLMDQVQVFAEDAKVATRAAGSQVINDLAKAMPLLISGSADLHGSTKNYIKEVGDFTADNHSGRNMLFGIREHAMGAIVNGIGYYGIFRPSGATFAVFADYMRPSVRISALTNLPIFHIWTHDSVAVGEDGPTHQPVETVSGLRVIPNLDVIRPADPEETAGAFVAALQRTNGPTGLILTRQGVPNLSKSQLQNAVKACSKADILPKKKQKNWNLSFWHPVVRYLSPWKRPINWATPFVWFRCLVWKGLIARILNIEIPYYPRVFVIVWRWKPEFLIFGENMLVLKELW